MANKIVDLETDNKRPARLCTDCEFFVRGLHAKDSRCRETGKFTDIERAGKASLLYRCGPDGKLWTKKRPSFLKRLGDAIIDRISRKQQHDRSGLDAQ